MSALKANQMYNLWLITTNSENVTNQSEHRVNTACIPCQTREKAREFLTLISFFPNDCNFLERFSFERRKVIGFAITMPHDWLKKLAPHFHPIRSKTKTNRDSLARIFPRFASATCNYYEF